MGWYIKGIDDEGLFVGEFMGLGLFESHIKAGDCSPDEEPILPLRFESEEEAENYLDSWEGGRAGCTVIFKEE